eukprot:4818038-Lingulodinium_polyedra.AAC.1
MPRKAPGPPRRLRGGSWWSWLASRASTTMRWEPSFLRRKKSAARALMPNRSEPTPTSISCLKSSSLRCGEARSRTSQYGCTGTMAPLW